MQTRTEYLSQLSQLDHMVKDMGDLVSSSLSQALQALWNSDKTLAGNIASQDNAIDNKERDIEHLCMTLLLRQQPVASDLRQVSSVMKLVSDLERIGDHSADIAEILSLIHIFPASPNFWRSVRTCISSVRLSPKNSVSQTSFIMVSRGRTFSACRSSRRSKEYSLYVSEIPLPLTCTCLLYTSFRLHQLQTPTGTAPVRA